jgi:hypothetical protein
MAKRNTGSVRRRNKVQAVRAEWRKAVAAWSLNPSFWQKEWGPPPDDPHCLCPEDILAEPRLDHPAMAA